MSTTYLLANADMVLTDGADNALRLHDLPRNPNHWHIEALVASGDFCELLAVTLEQIAAALPATSVEQYQLQDAIGNLLYVQRHYKLVKRTSDSYFRPSRRADPSD